MNKQFIEALKSKGYSSYMADMLDKMLSDLQGRVDELSKLTDMKFSLTIE